MIRFSVLVALPILALATLATAADPQSKPAISLTATLVSNKDSYPLVPAQSGEDFRKTLKNLEKSPKGAPPASKVDLTLRIDNPTDKPITISLGGDESQVTFNLTGEGAVTVDNMVAMTMEFRSGTPVTIQPGKSHEIPLTSLAGGSRGIGKMSYFTEAGDFKLSATLIAAMGDKQLTITSDAIAIKIVKR